ncbi:MAG TPA: alpha/beta hydrolase fold domain-containing protein [Verrucomicrobiae bacterium]|nr:alpha/beta hydrolase fold domain-containing protein [Verrucomicrobiae bacterium]
MKAAVFLFLSLSVFAAEKPPVPAPLGIPSPAPANDKSYAPQPILPGGIVMPLFAEGSPFLKADKVKEAEVYSVSKSVPGRINWITNIHNPSIEVHLVEGSLNTGTAVILCAGGGHNTLNVGTEAADFVPFFYNYGINSVILRNRLRKDGYKAEVDAVNDAMQAIRMVRAYATEFKLDPNRIGIMGFSAGAELAAPAAVFFEEWARTNNTPDDPFANISARPDFTCLVYPGPTPFNRDPKPAVPRNAPPAFITGPGSGDRIHAIWADQYFAAMLDAGIPNLEMHIYGNGFHPGSGSTGGLTDRNGTPLGAWQFRFIDWARDLGFLQKPGLETKAAKDTAEFLKKPAPRPYSIWRTDRSTNAPAR